ncbi:MAG: hypothetical protein KKD17_06870 [Nanoarchaeota archaeon]|nr:hypothetical protein [Nanoarchaeota archaeon]
MLFPELSDESRSNLEAKLLEKIPLYLNKGDYEGVLSTSELIGDLRDFVCIDVVATLSAARKSACRMGIVAEIEKGGAAARGKDYAALARSARRIRSYAEELRIPVPVYVRCYEQLLRRQEFDRALKKVLSD